MSAYRESVSGGPAMLRDDFNAILVSGPSWLGDSVMGMPAVHAFKSEDPSTSIVMLSKRGLVPLWRMHPDVDVVVELGDGFGGVVRASRILRKLGPILAYVFPQSFRSALVPFLARIPQRIGMPGHHRDWMLTTVSRPRRKPGREHQAYEYLDLIGFTESDPVKPPYFRPPEDVIEQCRERFAVDDSRPLVGIMPGAAFGPAKRWPPVRFAEVGRRLAKKHKCRIVLLGSSAEEEICSTIENDIGKDATNLSGETSLPGLAAMLSICSVVIANDSGGMHLAAAVGTKVVAIFGITDPAATGPMGDGHCILTAGEMPRGRDMVKDAGSAREALTLIDPDAVYSAAERLLA